MSSTYVLKHTLTGEEALQHFGVKGMKWGVTKSQASSSSSRGGRPTKVETGRRDEKVSSADIKSARNRNQAQLAKLIAADANVKLATTAKGKEAALKVWEKQAKVVNTSNDARVAAKFTKGEKVALVILQGPLAAVSIGANKRATSVKGWDKLVTKQSARNAKTVSRG